MQWQHNIFLKLIDELLGKISTSDTEITASSENFRVLYEAALEIEGGKNQEIWCTQLHQLTNLAHASMRDANTSLELTNWRAIYTDSCILRGLAQLNLEYPLHAISTLDHAIIIASPSTGRLDLILGMIKKIQSSLPPSPMHTFYSPPSQLVSPVPQFPEDTIPCIMAPSFFSFQSTFSKSPFIVRAYARNWPALNKHPWKSPKYLRSIAGTGRVVPVEVGHDYRSADWKQKIVAWDEFLSTLNLEDQDTSGGDDNIVYLAQYDLTKQFPALRDDIIVPDYVYASLGSRDWPNYHPPNNDEQLIVNTWLGPKDAMSPAHIDPYYNCYVQIVGYKSVWLAPPSVSSSMYSFKLGTMENVSNKKDLPGSQVGTTSQVDVFADVGALKRFPRFIRQAIPHAMVATLSPGDMLFFPPGWWHAMKSESTTFSLSMWF